jgi:hypothetical protein
MTFSVSKDPPKEGGLSLTKVIASTLGKPGPSRFRPTFCDANSTPGGVVTRFSENVPKGISDRELGSQGVMGETSVLELRKWKKQKSNK